MLAVESPFRQFYDLTGAPLQNGSLYFGTSGQNPETNPVTVYWDAAGTQPVAQPARTVNGYPVRAGSPAMIYVSGDMSVTVRDAKGRIVVSVPSINLFSNTAALQTQLADKSNLSNGVSIIGGAGRVIDNIATLRQLPKTGVGRAFAAGFYVAGDGGGGWLYLDLADITSADNNCTIFVASDGGRWKRVLNGPLNVKQAGAKGDGTTDDSAAFINALAAVNSVVIPSGAVCKVQNVFIGDGKELRGESGTAGIFVAAGTTGLVVGTDAVLGARINFPKNIRVHDFHIQGASVAANTIGIRVNQAVSARIYNLTYQACDQVINQQVADGCIFDNIRNINLEDPTTDCNYIVRAVVSARNNDNEYRNMIARAKIACLSLDSVTAGDPNAIHDGVTIQGNVFFPNSTAASDTVFLKNAIWTNIIGNKFFQPQRYGLRCEGTFTDATVVGNLFAFCGASQAAEAISVVTPAGAASGAFGGVDISHNAIISPSGHGIEISGIQGLTISDNTILAPNNGYLFAATTFTKYGIHLTKCGNYTVNDNTVTVSVDGRNSTLMPRNWMWDVVCESDCIYGVIDHKSAFGNDSLVLDTSGYATLIDNVPRLVDIPASSDAANGVDPYYGTPASWTKSNCTMSAVTDAANPVPNVPGANNTTQIVFTATANAFAQVGANATAAGGFLIFNAYMKASAGNALLTLQLQPNGGTQVSKPVVLDTTYRRVTFIVPGTVAAGFSTLTILNAGTNTPTINIAGLNVTTTQKPISATLKVAYGTAAPTVNFWNVGDRVVQKTPTVAQPKAWSCTAAGSPGTWVSEGNL